MIREEHSGDEAAIRALTTAAFDGMPHAGGNEADIVDRLRDCGALLLSLVHEEDGLRGHLALSPATVDGVSGWIAIGPVSVHPDVQRRGIGSALIEAALVRLRENRKRGVILAGNPAYYERFGFVSDGALSSRGIPPEHLLGLSFDAAPPRGEIAFHEAFRPN